MIKDGFQIDIVLKCYKPILGIKKETEPVTVSVIDKYDENAKYALKFKDCFKMNYRPKAMWDLVGEYIVAETKDEREIEYIFERI